MAEEEDWDLYGVEAALPPENEHDNENGAVDEDDAMAREAREILPPKIDLTEDKVNWKALEKEDFELATQIAKAKCWNMDRFWDKDWCAACSLVSEPGGGSQRGPEGVFALCNDATARSYEKCKMEVVVSTVRDIWIERQLSRMAAGEDPQTAAVRFWTRRQIYEHLHQHNRLRFTTLVQDSKRLTMIETEMFNGRLKVDPVTGIETHDLRCLKMYKEFNRYNHDIRAAKSKESQSGDKRFF